MSYRSEDIVKETTPPPPPPMEYDAGGSLTLSDDQDRAKCFTMKIGLSLDQFDRIRCLGRGSFGEAVLMRDRVSGELCVLKRVDIFMLDDKEMETRKREVVVLRKLSHPNVVKCHGFFCENDFMHVVLDYADKGDLEHVLESYRHAKRRFPVDVAVNVLVQCVNALSHVHAHSVIHRDIKPSNIFLTASGVVKLGDFGSARAMASQQDKATTFTGTGYYMAPEMIKSTEASIATDIWSLGVVMYELLCMKRPFEGNLVELAQLIVAGRFDPLPDYVDKELKDIVMRMMSLDATKRPKAVDIMNLPFVQAAIKQLVRCEDDMKSREVDTVGALETENKEGAQADGDTMAFAGEGMPLETLEDSITAASFSVNTPKGGAAAGDRKKKRKKVMKIVRRRVRTKRKTPPQSGSADIVSDDDDEVADIGTSGVTTDGRDEKQLDEEFSVETIAGGEDVKESSKLSSTSRIHMEQVEAARKRSKQKMAERKEMAKEARKHVADAVVKSRREKQEYLQRREEAKKKEQKKAQQHAEHVRAIGKRAKPRLSVQELTRQARKARAQQKNGSGDDVFVEIYEGSKKKLKGAKAKDEKPQDVDVVGADTTAKAGDTGVDVASNVDEEGIHRLMEQHIKFIRGGRSAIVLPPTGDDATKESDGQESEEEYLDIVSEALKVPTVASPSADNARPASSEATSDDRERRKDDDALRDSREFVRVVNDLRHSLLPMTEEEEAVQTYGDIGSRTLTGKDDALVETHGDIVGADESETVTVEAERREGSGGDDANDDAMYLRADEPAFSGDIKPVPGVGTDSSADIKGVPVRAAETVFVVNTGTFRVSESDGSTGEWSGGPTVDTGSGETGNEEADVDFAQVTSFMRQSSASTESVNMDALRAELEDSLGEDMFLSCYIALRQDAHKPGWGLQLALSKLGSLGLGHSNDALKLLLLVMHEKDNE